MGRGLLISHKKVYHLRGMERDGICILPRTKTNRGLLYPPPVSNIFSFQSYLIRTYVSDLC